MTVKGFLHRHVVIQAVHAIAWVLAVFAIGIGLSLALAPAEVLHLPTFHHTFAFAPPHVWGLGFIILGGWLTVCLARNPHGAPLPLFGMTALIGVWGLFTVPAVLNASGAITAVWAYTALGAIAAICGLSIDHQEGK